MEAIGEANENKGLAEEIANGLPKGLQVPPKWGVGFQITVSSLDWSSLLGRATNRHSHTHPTHTHHDSRLTLHSLFVAISHRASSNTHTGGPVIPVHYHVTHQLVHRGSSHVCTAVQTLNQPTTIPTTTRKYPPPSSPSSSALAAWPHGAERRSHHYAP